MKFRIPSKNVLAGWCVGHRIGLVGLAIAIGLVVGQRSRAGKSSPDADDPVAAVAELELWFPVGESFRYRLQWGIINVGEAWMTTEWVEQDGRRLLAIRGGASTGRLVEKIYPIENNVEALVDPVTFLPLQYRQRVREGRRRRDETTLFFHDRGQAEYTSHRTGKTKVIEIEPDTRDLLTLFYAVRQHGMETGQTASFNVLVDDDIYDLTLMAQELETVSLPEHGRVRTLRIEPTAMFGEVFVRRGRIWAWLSDDDRRVCVRLTGRIPVANVHAVLMEVAGPGDDQWVAGDARQR